MRYEHTGSVSAQAADGRVFRINICTAIIEGVSSSGPYEKEGGHELLTEEGDDVGYEGKGRYTVFSGHEEIPVISNDPDAP